MIERQFVDLSDDSEEGLRITHLTDAKAQPWSGIVRLYALDRFALPNAMRHDFFVLRGGVRDADGGRLSTGDFASGSSAETVIAEAGGATLFVYTEPSIKDMKSHRVHASARTWRAARAALMDVSMLSDSGHVVSLVRWRPGAEIPPHTHRGGEEILVLEGELRSARERHPAGTWLRLHADSTHSPFATVPTLILLRNGHLGPAGWSRAT